MKQKNEPTRPSDENPNHKRNFHLTIFFLVLFFVAIIISVTWCNSRPPAVLPGFTALHAIPAYSCVEDGPCKDKIILLKGQIAENSENIIPEIIKISKEWKTNLVCFDSPGGNSAAATKISLFLSENKMDTCVGRKFTDSNGQIITDRAICNSACPWILLAGNVRTAYSEQAHVGYHSSKSFASICGCKFPMIEITSQKKQFQNLIEKLAAARKASADELSKNVKLLNLSYEIPAEKLQPVSVGELLEKYKVLTNRAH